MELLKKIKRRIKKLFGKELTSEDLNDILKGKGITIGKKTIFYAPKTISVDISRPWLVEIGEYTKITQGVIILSHDYSRSVLRRKYGDILNEAGRTVIGNNAIILMGTHIGDNVIVGAGSVVSGYIPDNVVIAGNPAKIIRTLDEHYKIRKEKQISEAKICAREFFNRYHKIPTINDMGAFFPLYLKRDIEELRKNNLRTNLGGDEEREVIESFLKSKSVYENYEKFLDDTFDDINWRNYL